MRPGSWIKREAGVAPRRALLGAVALAFAAAATAQSGDSRCPSIAYRDDQAVRVRAAPGYQVTIELASDEPIGNIALGDGAAWQVTANKAGNLLFVKPLQLNPPTNMTVASDVRRYRFELVGVAEPGGDLPFAIRFRYPPGRAPAGRRAARSGQRGRCSRTIA